MRSVYKDFDDDLNVACLFAEALLNRTPWALWDLKTETPADGANTLEVMRVLEKALAQASRQDISHCGLLHMYIHTMEMSPQPEKALTAADTLAAMQSDAGHLLHMPSHVYILCGMPDVLSMLMA